MKKNILFIISILCLFLIAFSSCSKDKNDEVTIRGKWYAKSFRTRTYEDTGTTPAYDSTETISGDVYFDFAENGTVTTKDEDGEVNTFTYTYSESTKKLIITDEGEPEEFDVVKLTANELSLTEVVEDDIDDIEFRIVYDFNFTR